MGAGADAGIFVGAPIDQIVPALAARPRMIGNLVSRQSGCRADVLGGVVERARGVLVGQPQFARGVERKKWRLRLDRELIERKVVAGLRQRRLQLARPGFGLLVRPGVDEIERVAIEHAARDGDGVERLTRRMHAAEFGQHAIVERLHAERHPIDAGGAVAAKARRLDTGRIGFERDLGVRRDPPLPGDRIEHARDRRRLHQRRSAAAEKDRRHRTAAQALGNRPDLGVKGFEETRLVDRLAAHVAVEVAIRTFRQAERPVDIDAEGLRVVSHNRFG